MRQPFDIVLSAGRQLFHFLNCSARFEHIDCILGIAFYTFFFSFLATSFGWGIWVASFISTALAIFFLFFLVCVCVRGVKD